MRKTKLAISLAVIGAAILFAGNYDVYAGGGTSPWPINTNVPKKSTTWTGNLVITAEIANISGSPAPGLPADVYPTLGGLYQDVIVKISFFVRLENSSKGYATFSGLAKYDEVDSQGKVTGTYYLFYVPTHYGSGLIGAALNKFLTEKVYLNLPPGGYSNGALTSVTNGVYNVDTQLKLDQYGRQNFQPETPLYFNADITVATW